MLYPRRLAVLVPNWVGDVAMATPALRALRRCWPDASITHIGPAVALQTLTGAGLSDERIEDRSRQKPRLANLHATAAELRRRRCELAVLLPNSMRSALLCRLAGISRLVGYDRDGRGFLLADGLSPLRGRNGRFVPVRMIDYYLELVRALGADSEDTTMRLAVMDEDEAAAVTVLDRAGFNPRRPLVMLNPGAAFGTSKMWPTERYAGAADALVESRDAQIVIHAAPSEQPVAAEVAEAMNHRPMLNFARRQGSIGLLKALCARCDVVITNDTGARHVAAAMGAGVVTVFGSTDPAWARIDYDRERILRADVPCSPCQKPICPLPAGPHYHQCMSEVTVEQVVSAAEELLTAATGRTGR